MKQLAVGDDLALGALCPRPRPSRAPLRPALPRAQLAVLSGHPWQPSSGPVEAIRTLPSRRFSRTNHPSRVDRAPFRPAVGQDAPSGPAQWSRSARLDPLGRRYAGGATGYRSRRPGRHDWAPLRFHQLGQDEVDLVSGPSRSAGRALLRHAVHGLLVAGGERRPGRNDRAPLRRRRVHRDRVDRESDRPGLNDRAPLRVADADAVADYGDLSSRSERRAPLRLVHDDRHAIRQQTSRPGHRARAPLKRAQRRRRRVAPVSSRLPQPAPHYGLIGSPPDGALRWPMSSLCGVCRERKRPPVCHRPHGGGRVRTGSWRSRVH